MEDSTIIFNGTEYKVQKGTPLLSIARSLNIFIPTLCHNDALVPYGACRMCIVEIQKGNRMRVVTSCNYPAEDGLVVKTDTEKVISTRNIIMELLIARAPKNKQIKQLGERLGVTKTRFEEVGDDCIMCGMCIRACEEVVGVSAIGFKNRGITRMPATPFMETSKNCIGCGSCVYVCPTKYIKMEDKGAKRYIYNWKVAFDMLQCKKCGDFIAPVKQLDYIKKKVSLPEDFFEICNNCR